MTLKVTRKERQNYWNLQIIILVNFARTFIMVILIKQDTSKDVILGKM